ncbi:phosphotransferase [Streptomyces reniochalinae]|uniref:Aminoglycoside phosphotransferase family protein n=1 Tax=Streptomyces reniochalinae TaxID=2250578 RepID=A0A367EB84_9ACTN|nr:phosphotransferase [Streptomyces reniochalinae]RCG15314.1 aminoglycoside phosphotransferase family protein [Streptomyces reniochalinae]
MPGFLTPDQLAARTSRARDAAVAAGRALGLTVTDARVLHDVFSVVVHLAPSPVVVRVPTVLPSYADPDTQAERQRRELDVVGRLAREGTPVIPPSPLVPAEPVRRDGFSMTLWQYVEQDSGAEPDYVRNCGLVAGLHAALRAYPGQLPFLSAAEPEFVTDSFAVLADRPDLLPAADLDRARREWEILEPVVRSRAGFEAAFPGIDLQPIHGDAPAANIVTTEDGELYSDFELVTYGPAEWDLAGLGPEGEAAYNAAARRAGTRELDERVLRLVNAVGACRAVACLALAPQLPLLVEAVEPALDSWRAAPFAGGLSDLSAGG